jgi:hypothetical protein
MATKRRWVPIVFGVLILIGFLVIGVIVAGVVLFQQSVQTMTSSEADAEREFTIVRDKYSSRAPLLEMNNGVPRYTGGTAPAASAQPVTLETLNVMVWDPREEELTRIALPFWLLRMKSDPIRLSAYASGMDDDGVSLRPEDIERYGAGIVLDMTTTTPTRARILVWTQ